MARIIARLTLDVGCDGEVVVSIPKEGGCILMWRGCL